MNERSIAQPNAAHPNAAQQQGVVLEVLELLTQQCGRSTPRQSDIGWIIT